MSGRDRLEIGTYGDINTTTTVSGAVRAEARYRDWDGEVRKVTATARTSKAAKREREAPNEAGMQWHPAVLLRVLAPLPNLVHQARRIALPGQR